MRARPRTSSNVSDGHGLFIPFGEKNVKAAMLRATNVSAPNDYLVSGKMEGYPDALKRLPPAVQIETFIVGGPGGRTMSMKDAGLYSNGFGSLMWAWRTGEWNHYELWRFR
jgi:hypothetical protein